MAPLEEMAAYTTDWVVVYLTFLRTYPYRRFWIWNPKPLLAGGLAQACQFVSHYPSEDSREVFSSMVLTSIGAPIFTSIINRGSILQPRSHTSLYLALPTLLLWTLQNLAKLNKSSQINEERLTIDKGSVGFINPT